MVIAEQPSPQRGQQYPSDEMVFRDQARMESQLQNFAFSDTLALDQYHGDNAIFGNYATNFHGGRK